MKRLLRFRRLSAAMPVLVFSLNLARADTDLAARVAQGIEKTEELLKAWQFVEAKEMAERLLAGHPDLPAVQFAAGWVKFHLGDHQTALALAERAAAAFGGRMDRDPRLSLIRATARIIRSFSQETSTDGQVMVFYRPGPDQILVPYLVEAVQRTLQVVGEDLGHRLDHPVLVEIVPDIEALADMTGLMVEEIRRSGTIAVCKYGRLMITSPRATLKGFGWLDTTSHELVHMIISEKTRNYTPIWLHEALAKLEEQRWRAGEPLYREGLPPLLESDLARALATGSLITFEQMHPSMALLPSQEAASLAFSEVYTAARFLIERRGYAGIRELLSRLRRGSTDMQAIETVYGLNQEAFVRSWLGWLKQQRLRQLDGEPLADEDVTRRRNDQSPAERVLSAARQPEIRDYFHLGQLLRARGWAQASAVEYAKAVKQAGPNHATAWFLMEKLGLVLMALGQPEKARKTFEESLGINPLGLEAHLHLGKLLLDEDQYTAWLHLRECVRVNPLDPRVHALSHQAAKKLLEKGDERQDWKVLMKRHQKALDLLAQGAPKDSGPPQGQEEGQERQKTLLRIHTRPWARVWIDYRDTGLTTPVFSLKVDPGPHVVGLVAACEKEPLMIQLVAEEGEMMVIDRDLCPEQPRPENPTTR